MRILILTASLPYPPASGGALRSFGIIHGLHTAGHEVSLLSFHDDSTSPQSTPLAEYCSRIETMPASRRTKARRLRDLLLSTQPDIARRLYSPAFSDRLQLLLKEFAFDLIQFEGIEVACYLPLARQAQPHARLCFDTFNAEYALQRTIFEIERHDIRRWPAAMYSWVQSRRIARFERHVCQQADRVIAVSPEDADLLRPFRPDGHISVVPSGIFTEDYTGGPRAPLGENALVFTGKMDYRPNIDAVLWFADEVLPRIMVHKRIPDGRFYVVGQQPTNAVQLLTYRPNVTVSGWVESVQPYLQAADVYVAPLRMGSGTRLKLLEAMAAGCAIVATSTAASGLVSEAKQAMRIADTADEIAHAITTLLRDPAQRRALGERARETVRRYYDWQVLIPRLLAVYGEMGLG